jgi:hypothetical protein
MSVPRRVAVRLLRVMIRHSSPGSRTWGDAMLRELDFVEGDWQALLWSLGSAVALVRHSVPRRLRSMLGSRIGSAGRLALTWITTNGAGVLAGMSIAAAVLVLSAWGGRDLVSTAVPEWQAGHTGLLELLTFVLIPETTFGVAAFALWRRRRNIAVGLLLSAMTFTTHVVVHTATHN